MKRIYGKAAIEWAREHGRKTVKKFGDPTEKALERCSLDKAEKVICDDQNLIYIDIPSKEAH